ncbi:MAG TPA: hypothetical protein VF753_18105 [Terriglobales bacterium]
MKLGAENRNKVIAAGALGALALILVLRAVISPGGASSPSTSVAASVPAASPVPAAKRNSAKIKPQLKHTGPPRSLDPELRYDWLKASEDMNYNGDGRNIFSAQAPIPKPVAPGVTDAQKAEEDTGPPPPPPPPPINLKFFGFASRPGEPKKVFLSQGEDVFIASEGEIVNRRYKIVRIQPMSVEVEDEMNNHRQSIPLTQGPQA